MKILFGTGINRVNNVIKSNKTTGKEVSKRNSVFDELTVSARESRAPSDVIDSIKKQTAADIISGTPVSDLDDIKLQIAKGSYEANVAQIANKLMFDII